MYATAKSYIRETKHTITNLFHLQPVLIHYWTILQSQWDKKIVQQNTIIWALLLRCTTY